MAASVFCKQPFGDVLVITVLKALKQNVKAILRWKSRTRVASFEL